MNTFDQAFNNIFKSNLDFGNPVVRPLPEIQTQAVRQEEQKTIEHFPRIKCTQDIRK